MDITCEDCQIKLDINTTAEYRIFCDECLKKKQICSIEQCKKKYLLCDDDIKNLKPIYTDNPKNKNKLFIFSDINEIKKQYEMKKRKQELIEELNNNKLEYKNYGDCFSYVKYGIPSIETVILNELSKLEIKRNRKIKLALELSKYNIQVDENLPSCYNYINNIGCKTLKETVREIKVEHYIKNNTKYNEYLESFDPIKAKRLAKKDLNVKNIRICFD